MKDIGILILFFNKVDQTIECVNSFLPSGQNIYVLNNGSDAGQLKKLIQIFHGNNQLHILDAGKNLGVSGGRNFLISHTKESWLFFVDNDIVIRQQHTWVEVFKQFIYSNIGVKIVSPLLYNVHDQVNSPQIFICLDDNRMQIMTGTFQLSNCFPGGASIIHRSVFEIYGLFDEGMFVGFEDYEFALRAMLAENGSLEVHSLDAIELIHDHRFQKSMKDKEAVRQRYSEEKMKASYDRLVSKYGIAFDHDWRWWTNKQIHLMTRKESLFAKIKNAIASRL